MRLAPFAAVSLLLLSNCTIETRQAPPAAAANPPPPAAPAAPVATAAPTPTATTTVVATAVPAPTATAAGTATMIAAPPPMSKDPLPQQPPVIEPPPPIGPVSPLPNSMTAGQPPGLHPGAPPAYWIWRDNDGWWHVRTTSSKGQVKRFWGRATPMGAEMSEIRATRSDLNDRLKMTPKNAFWTFDTEGHTEGFDFRTKGGGQCVTFHVHGNAKDLVYIGAKQLTPPTNHFQLCP